MAGTRASDPPDPRREREEFRENCTDVIRRARDHAHWHGVIRRRPTAKLLEGVLEAAFRMAIAVEGRIARGEE